MPLRFFITFAATPLRFRYAAIAAIDYAAYADAMIAGFAATCFAAFSSLCRAMPFFSIS